MEEPLQKSLERYDVLDRIAVGGMAEVFLAKAYGAHGFEKTLAIKRILPELARDPEFEARFIAEAKVAVRLSHANVVQVFDFGRIGESLFIAMEYVDGLDLAALLRKFKDEGRLVPLPAAFHIAIEIIRALDFAHGHNVVHRDVSPSNILISRAGEVKIGDFGIAIAASPHKAAGPGSRKVMGKWRYMSPEQARGDTLDTRSDLFSAASVLFELFTGDKLFPGDEAEEIIKNIDNMPIPKASSIRPGLPSRLDDILAGPLSRKPIDRPSRPAVVLRSLIELSYESSIMATALDVAEAVAAVLPAKRSSGPGQQLDDVIRKQLGENQDKSVARRTAVTDGKPPSTATLARDQVARQRDPGERGEVSTGMFRKIDADGVSRLEEVDADPTAVKRPPADSGIHKLLDAHFDPDRHTEVGGPPTGQVPKTEPIQDVKTPTATMTAGSRRGLAAGLAIVALAAAGGGAWLYLRDRGQAVVPIAIDDARPTEPLGTFAIDPTPEGATGSIVGEDKVVHSFGPTSHAKPARLRVSADKKLRVHLDLAGYMPFDGEYSVFAGETLGITPTLVRAHTELKVDTKPEGALVTLGGHVLGETPLDRSDLEPATGVELVITRAGYETAKLKVELVVGKPTAIVQPLTELQKQGTVTISVNGHATWGNVYFKGRNLGQNTDVGGQTQFHLPLGRQQVTIVNPHAGKKTIEITVTNAPQAVTVTLD